MSLFQFVLIHIITRLSDVRAIFFAQKPHLILFFAGRSSTNPAQDEALAESGPDPEPTPDWDAYPDPEPETMPEPL